MSALSPGWSCRSAGSKSDNEIRTSALARANPGAATVPFGDPLDDRQPGSGPIYITANGPLKQLKNAIGAVGRDADPPVPHHESHPFWPLEASNFHLWRLAFGRVFQRIRHQVLHGLRRPAPIGADRRQLLGH